MALEPAGLRWISEGLPKFVDDTQRANRAMGDAGDAAERASGGFSVLDGVVMGVATAMTTFAIDAAMKLGSALVDLATDSVGLAIDFESMTSRMDIAAGAAADQAAAFGGLGEVALKVGGDVDLLGVSGVGAADAMTGLLKSGLSLEAMFGDLDGYMKDTTDLGGALRASIDLAAASELDMVQASDVAITTLATFGAELESDAEKAKFVTESMNVLVKAADASVAEVSDLTEALGYVGPAAAAMNMTFEETNTALALLSTRGISGSRAGTSLEAMFRSLQDPSKKAMKAMDELGISIYDAATGEMLPAVDILGMFEMALKNKTQADRDAAMGAMFTAQGQRAMNVLLGEGVEGWLEMGQKMEGAATISEQAEARAATYAGQMEALQGNIETLKIRIGTALLPTLTDMIGVFSELVDRYGPQMTQIFEAIGEVASFLSEKLLRLLTGEITLESLLPPSLVEIGEKVIETIQFLGQAFENLGTGAAPVMQRMIEVGQGLAAFFAPTIERLQEGFAKFLIGLAPLQPIFERLFASVQAALPVLGDLAKFIGVYLVFGFRNLLEVISAMLPGISQIFTGLVTIIVGILTGLIDVISGIFQTIIGLITGDSEKAKEGALRVLEGLGVAVESIFVGLLTTLEGLMNAIIDGIVSYFNVLKNILVGESIIPDMINSIVDWFAKLPELILAVLGGFAETIGELFESVFGALLEFDPKELADIFSQLLGGVQSLGDAWETLMSTMRETWSVFSDHLMREVWPLLEAGWVLLTTRMADAWSQALDLMELQFGAFQIMVTSDLQRIGQAWERLSAVIQATTRAIAQAQRRIMDFTGWHTVDRLGRVASLFRRIKDQARAAAWACAEAARACGGIGGGTVPGFQAGGMFQVPAAAGPQGMLIRVHPRELVSVIPAAQAAGGFGREISVNVGPVYVGDEFDWTVFADRVKTVVADAIES